MKRQSSVGNPLRATDIYMKIYFKLSFVEPKAQKEDDSNITSDTRIEAIFDLWPFIFCYSR
jgi:hypothetical protein